jgi:hypothetical protein
MPPETLLQPPPGKDTPPARGIAAGGAPRINPRVIQTDRKALFAGKFYRAALIVSAVVLLLLVSFVQTRLNTARDKLGLTRVSPLENAPPVLAFTTVALGGFRGLIANMLWLRATDLQEEDKYFEMVQLADWITKLQPHFVTVWVHQAWNMAYNISIKFTDPADRWQWVRRGIELLRDDGLKYNPNEPLIYRELAWFFQHKMGADLDDAQKYYKAVWVNEMNQIFGRGQPNWDELLHPQTAEAQSRVKVLRETYKMNPEWMKEVDDLYGPLEWHLPESHAIYWAYIALEKTDKRKLKKEDLITCRRVIFQSLQLAFRRGRLIYPNKTSDAFIYAPNLKIVAQANKAYLQMMEDEREMRENIGNGHKNFLKWAVYYLYLYGQMNQAEEWWKYLHEHYPNSTPPGQTVEEYGFQRAQETAGETAEVDAKAMLEGMIREAFLYIALGEEARGATALKLAEKFRDRFQESVGPKSIDRVGLPPLAEIKQEVLNEMLDPQAGLEPSIAAQLRTNLGLPAASTPPAATNQPGLNPAPNGPVKPATK